MLDREVRDLIRLLDEMGVAELQVERGDLRIHIRRGQGAVGEGAEPVPASVSSPDPPVDHTHTVLSLAVGYFYRCDRSGARPVAEEGQSVARGQRIGFVETMGVMGEVLASVDGSGLEFLVEDGQGVEYGQPLAQVRSPIVAD